MLLTQLHYKPSFRIGNPVEREANVEAEFGFIGFWVRILKKGDYCLREQREIRVYEGERKIRFLGTETRKEIHV